VTAYTCPRCRRLVEGRHYGPCRSCRAALAAPTTYPPPAAHDDEQGDIEGWDWPAIRALQAKAAARLLLAPRCQLCGQAMAAGQLDEHRVCRQALDRVRTMLNQPVHQSTNTPTDQAQPLDVARPVVHDVPSGGRGQPHPVGGTHQGAGTWR